MAAAPKSGAKPGAARTSENPVNYQDFDLLIDRAGESLRAQVMSSPAGQATAEFRLPFSGNELENFLLRMRGRARSGTIRRVESQEMSAVKAFGAALFGAVFSGDVKACFRTSLDETRRQNAGLRIRLRLADPSVVDLPWEYLYNPAVNRFLALSIHTPLVRYMDLPERIQPLTVTPPIRVLVMISSPTDFPAIDVEAEWTRLNQALADLIGRNQIAIERLDDATLEALQRRLRRERYHAFHFIGRGEFDDSLHEGVLMFERDKRAAHRISSQYLGMLLHDHETLRVAILNACEGARTSRTDPFARSAQSLVHQGIPAVIAMQFGIANDVASRFAHEFYGALADGYPIDASLTEARKAIFAAGHEVEWGTPVLYLRVPDGRIFDVDRGAEAAARVAHPVAASSPSPAVVAYHSEPREPMTSQEQSVALLRSVGEVLGAGHYARALELLAQVRALDPSSPELADLTAMAEAQRAVAEARAQRRAEFREHLDAAAELLARNDLAAASERATEALRLHPADPEARAVQGQIAKRIEEERLTAAVERRIDEAIARAEVEPSHGKALAILEEARALDPGNAALLAAFERHNDRLGRPVPCLRGPASKPDSASSSDGLSELFRRWWSRLRKGADTVENRPGHAGLRRECGPSDVVHCTVFSAHETVAGQTFVVKVTAHVPEQEHVARTLAKQTDREAEPRGKTVATAVTPHVSRLAFCLSMTGAEVVDPVQTLIWKRITESVEFEVRVPDDYPAGRLTGTVIVSQDGIPFGHVRFAVYVTPERRGTAAGEKSRSTGDWKRYRHAFVSYAAADRAEVLKRVQMLARVSIDFFQDLLNLEPGERWERELYKQIDRSDVFFLFWSTAAKNSEWVAKEIDYALRRKRGDELAEPEIVPIMIEGPPPVPPPPALRHLHFNDPFIYFIQSPPVSGQR